MVVDKAIISALILWLTYKLHISGQTASFSLPWSILQNADNRVTANGCQGLAGYGVGVGDRAEDIRHRKFRDEENILIIMIVII